jgi:hypothetical protein
MNDVKRTTRQAIVTGAAASLLSAAVLVIAGYIENGRPAGPLNGPSQWIFGRRAAYARRPSLRHTLTGFLIHHATATGWAWLHEWLFGADKRQQSASQRLGRAAVTASVANVVDYKLTPKRLQPGFEAQLSRTALFVVYAAFAVGLAAAAKKGDRGHQRQKSSVPFISGA